MWLYVDVGRLEVQTRRRHCQFIYVLLYDYRTGGSLYHWRSYRISNQILDTIKAIIFASGFRYVPGDIHDG